MKQKRALKGRRLAQLSDARLLGRLLELQKLREQVRLAEIAMQPKDDTTFTRHH
jgi:hypothetical protein